MTIWCYAADSGRWGQMLHKECISRNWDAKLFTNYARPMPGDYAFLRIPQWNPECDLGKRMAVSLAQYDCTLIPDLTTCKTYEDKMAQTRLYSDWMPETHVICHPCSPARLLDDSVDVLTLPFISKGNVASASANVRLVRTREEALAEYAAAFNGDGLPLRAGGKDLKQKGYLIWQKFLAGNNCDYRVCINGEYLNVLKRGVRSHLKPFASGSGDITPITQLNRDTGSVLAYAERFFHEFGLTWCGIDIVWDYDLEKWSVLETTLGWSFKAYEDCVYFNELEPTKYTGRDMFKVLCEGIIHRSFLK